MASQDRNDPHRPFLWQLVAVAALAGAFVLVITIGLLRDPDWLLPPELTSAAELAKLEARKLVVQLAAGVLAVGGLIYGSFRGAQAYSAHTQKNAEARQTREQEVHDRFLRACELFSEEGTSSQRGALTELEYLAGTHANLKSPILAMFAARLSRVEAQLSFFAQPSQTGILLQAISSAQVQEYRDVRVGHFRSMLEGRISKWIRFVRIGFEQHIVRRNPSDQTLSAILASKRAERLDLIGVELKNLHLRELLFWRTDFVGCSFAESRLETVCFKECSFEGVSFRGGALTNCSFVGSNGANLDFEDSTLSGCGFWGDGSSGLYDASFFKASFKDNCGFHSISLKSCRFEGCNLVDERALSLSDCDLTGSRFSPSEWGLLSKIQRKQVQFVDPSGPISGPTESEADQLKELTEAITVTKRFEAE